MGLPFEVAVNEAGHLAPGGCDALELAGSYGTPLYIVDEEAVRRACRRYRNALAGLEAGGMAAYAAKAFWVGGMAALVAEEGLGADVSSEAELRLALRAGLDPGKLILHGNNKSRHEMELAVRLGVGRVVLDSLWELEQWEQVGAAAGRRVRVLLRLLPGVRAGAHGSIQTGHGDSKFGIPIKDGQAEQAVERCMKSRWLEFRGYHVHIGSQILEIEPYRRAASVVAEFAARMASGTGAVCREIDMGGGLGARYTDSDRPPPIESLVEAIASTLQAALARAGLPMPFLILEPGRSVVAEAGTTLYRMGAIKRLAAGQLVAAVDGGMSDNPRVALYQARYTAVLARSPYGVKGEPVQIVGRLCESGDILVERAELPPFESGDVLAVLTTGAYHHSMASNYNGLPRPPVVAVRNGQARLWVRREAFEDMIATDVVLAAGPDGSPVGGTG